MRTSLAKNTLFFVLLICCKVGTAQTPISAGATVPDLAIAQVLNHAPVSSLSGLQKKITIVDFFGTWCIPCLRAMPDLTKLAIDNKANVSVVLVATETAAQLNKFIAARKDFFFPIIVDEGEVWNARFGPPALPFTVVLDANRRVLAVTEAAEITPALLQSWMSAKPLADTFHTTSSAAVLPVKTASIQLSNNGAVRLSQQFMYAAKTGNDATAWLDSLRSMDFQKTLQALANDNAKKAFWINLYNGSTQLALHDHPEKYQSRNKFFAAKLVDVGGVMLSLDEIEHGILRRSKIKWSLGYFNKWFVSKQEKAARVDRLDNRIHFALNCGAKSCPPIAFYSDQNLDAQLETATKAFLSSEVKFDAVQHTVAVPKLMSWFRHDFGGKKGIRTILKAHGLLPSAANPKIIFSHYDWTLTLDHYNTTD